MNMLKYDGIIFDLDGTLLDTLEDLSNSVNEALGMYGYKRYAKEDYKLKIGGGFRDLLERSLPTDTPAEMIDRILSSFLAVYDKNYRKNTKPYNGIGQTLIKLRDAGMSLAVNSNKRDDYTKILLSDKLSMISFIAIYGERTNIPKKPDPAAAEIIIKTMNIPKSKIIYVGDSKTDILTAKNAGIESIGVTWGFRDRKELEKYGAVYIADRPEDILNIVGTDIIN
ncbi:HAD family hydrolase [Pectinatus haikarae]|uniref:Phosphoglycolate phosphatase n=1 Tax=Pectinatus haikarae TaxID=349096 RepID=A0ABT9YCH0_9FIRM|nr:HAD family hydrolase [Pectinatus haikarae]MDQ0205216.1 phosphoglycolate phosphatase [Pectinatus haikarae]